MTHTPYPETQVNTYTTGAQSLQITTALSDGGWVVQWWSASQDGDNVGVFQQAYNADGTARGSETQVNTYTTSSQFLQDTVALADGGWVVTWQSGGADDDSLGVYQQVYNQDGSVHGGEVLVNTYTTGNQSEDRIAALSDGGWVVTWHSQNEDGSNLGIYQQAYDADGTAMGGEVQVNSHTTGDQSSPEITAIGDGGWVVTWSSSGQDGSGKGVYQQAYHADGMAMGGEVEVNSYTTGDQNAQQVATLADGGWVVTWISNGQDGGGNGVYQQAYHDDGTALGGEVQVNTYTTGAQVSQKIAALTGGGWVVAWTSPGQDGDGYGVYLQAYDADGTAEGGETRVNTYTTNDQSLNSIVALADGGWVVVWTSTLQDDGSNSGVYQQAYHAGGTANGGETQVNTYTTAGQQNASVAALDDGGWVVTWASYGQDGDATGVYQQRYDADGQVYGSNHAPTAADDMITALANGRYSFSKGTFGFSDGDDGDKFASVVITALPSAGKLLLDGAAVTDGQEIAAADLKGLVWQAGKHALAATIGFQVTDDGGTEAGGKDTSEVHTLTFAIDTDTFTGTKAAEKLIGTDGHDILIGKGGNDRLTGGGGPDTFVFKTGDGKDTIMDFDPSQGDKIDLSDVDGITSYKDLTSHHLSIHDANVWITDGDGDKIVLRDVSTGDLHKGDFVF